MGTPRFLSREGRILPGERLIVTPANPPAGQDWSLTVPAGKQWRILSGTGLLQTSATVANRKSSVAVKVGAAQLFLSGYATAQAASTNVGYSYMPATSPVAPADANGQEILYLPDMWLPGQSLISASTSGLQAGDQWSLLAFAVEEVWFANQDLEPLGEVLAQPVVIVGS